MNFVTISAIAAFLFFLSGCSHLPPIDQKAQIDLRTPTKPRSFRLETLALLQDTSSRENGKQGFFPGTYVAEKENSVGTFFRCEKYCLFYPSAGGRYFLRTGGVWIPKDPSRNPRVYAFFNYEYKELNSFEAVLDQNASPLEKISGVNVIVTPYSPAGAASGLIASGIINSIITSGTGEIQWLGEIIDIEFADKIRKATE